MICNAAALPQQTLLSAADVRSAIGEKFLHMRSCLRKGLSNMNAMLGLQIVALAGWLIGSRYGVADMSALATVSIVSLALVLRSIFALGRKEHRNQAYAITAIGVFVLLSTSMRWVVVNTLHM